jgi:uncharacterized membrane protein YraQ (UPF0718 family)
MSVAAERDGLLKRDPVSSSWRYLWLMLAGLVGTIVLLRVARPDSVPWLQNFILLFSSLLVEAVPFILIGAIVSAAIEVLVPSRWFERMGRLPHTLQLPAAAMAGLAFPVCECGSVPVARRLAKKGLSPSAAVTFMLAAPVLNPVVLASTMFAYRGRQDMWLMVLGRAGLGLVVAVIVGWVIGDEQKAKLLRARPEEIHHEGDLYEARWKEFFGHVGNDFIFMARYLMLGGMVAAAVQTFVPQSVMGRVAGQPVVAIVAMMGLAFVLSLCSESDAFVAASFVQFSSASQLAFLVFGPMMDMKLASLYIGTYGRNFFWKVLVTVTTVTLVGCLWILVVFG